MSAVPSISGGKVRGNPGQEAVRRPTDDGARTTRATRPADVEGQPGKRSIVRLVFAVLLAGGAFLTVAAVLSSGLGLVDMARWAATQQRAFHHMVSELLALDGGEVWAASALIAACLGYGFLHAAIPGHGKFVIAGAALASRMGALRLVLLSAAASMAQAVTAIVLVYGSFTLLDITAGWAMVATDRVLVPLSYLAILAIGLILTHRALRGLRGVWRAHAHRVGLPHTHGPGCGHRHGPTPAEADAIRSWRDAAVLVFSIGLRPCTGAVFVLVAAWRMDLLVVGVVSAVAMAVGTGAFIALVALSAVSARGATLFAAGSARASVAVPLLQLLAGIAISLISVAFLVGAFLPPL